MAGTIESPRKVFVSNLVGCESTSSEGMRVINYLKLNGHTILEEPEDAEYVVINTCAFVDVQRRKMTELLADVTAKAPAAKLIIMGCAREIAPETLEAYSIELLCGHYDLDKLDSLFFTRVKFREAERFSQHSSLNKTVIIASRGCVGHCTYCSIKRSTGNVKSQPIQAVLDDIRDATAKGLREFFISGDDLGSYGLDIHTNLPSLLREIVALDLDIKVLLGNINPRWVNEYIDDLAWFFQQDIADKWIFIPIQSGNNEVLSSMGRTYTIEACEESIRRLQSIEGMKLYYDLIVGFPTETDDAFMDTLNFVLNFPPSHVTVTSFSREAGTPAYDLEPLAKEVLHDRQKRLVMVYTAAQNILSRQDPTLVREFGT